MRTARIKAFTVVGFVFVAGTAVLSLVTPPLAHAACQPVACPAIAKICPQGQIACRVSPCNCALACTAEGHGCQIPNEPL